MSTLTQAQFDALPASVQESLRVGGYAPGGAQQGAGQGVPPAQTQQPADQGQPPAPNLDDVPEQSSNGPQFLPYDREFNFTGTVAQVQYRFSQRTGPNYYATFTVDEAGDAANNAGIVQGTVRSLIWKFNPAAYGTDKDKSDASLRRYRDFIRQISGLPEGAPVQAVEAQLRERSKATPSLGIRVKVVSTRGGEMKNKPGSFFHNLVFIPLG